MVSLSSPRPVAAAANVGNHSGEATPRDISLNSNRYGDSAEMSPENSIMVGTAAGYADNEKTETAAVKVVVRLRPSLTDEEMQDRSVFVVTPNGKAVETADGSYCFEFSKAFPEETSQEVIYNYVGRPIIDAVLGGYNGTILAYGQTGSGKTFSMMGPSLTGSDGQQGIVPRAAQQVFDYVSAVGACEGDGFPSLDTEFTLRCSFLEVYREQMRDLLRPEQQKLRVKELPQLGLYVDGLSREHVNSKAEVMNVLRVGLRARSVARTRQNQHSSRSHAIFALHVEQRTTACTTTGGRNTEKLGKLTLVDLAGSEKVSKSECVGKTLEEAKKINWSLTALGKVIDSLVEQRSHVPYRDSRLTRVLEETLGGNCRTTLLVTASACSQHYDETLSSLRFATRTAKVRNHVKVNYMYSSDQLLGLVAQLRRDLVNAKKQIAHLSVAAQARRPEMMRRHSKKNPGLRAKRYTWAGITDSIGGSSGVMSTRLSYSGSAPTMYQQQVRGGTNAAAEDDDQRRQSVTGGSSLIDIDEMSCLNPTSTFPSSMASGRSPLSSRSCSSASSDGGDEFGDPSSLSLRGLGNRPAEDEVWRPLAIASREAVISMEAALVAQEQALDEARLLFTCEKPHETPSMTDSVAGRFRSLRHAVDARQLHWRLHLERQRTECLALELEMRKGYSEELERTLEERTSRLREMVSLMQLSPDSNSELKGLGNHRLNLDALRRAPMPRQASASGDDSPLRVAGTGDTGEVASSSSGMPTASCTPQDPTPVAGCSGHAGLEPSAAPLSFDTLDQLQAELARREFQIAELASELGTRDVRISSLRHEATIKDTLLKRLGQETVRRAQGSDEGVEVLLREAMMALSGMLSQEQSVVASAGAVGERVLPPADRPWPFLPAKR